MLTHKSSSLKIIKDFALSKLGKSPTRRSIFRNAQSQQSSKIPISSGDKTQKFRLGASSEPTQNLQNNKFRKVTLIPKISHLKRTSLDKAKTIKGIANPNFRDLEKSQINFKKTNLKIEISCSTKAGTINKKIKPVNQDNLIALKNLSNDKNYAFAAVFDGHGPQGHKVSSFVESTYSSVLKSSHFPKKSSKFADFFRDLIIKTISCLNSSSIDLKYSGTTLLSVFLAYDEICCTNIGDSKAILGSFNESWSFNVLNKEHKPYELAERTRIERCGGKIEQMKNSNGKLLGPVRVWGKEPNSPGLAMSRTIGDSFAKEVGVTDEPDINVFKLKECDKFIVIATDGLWDLVSDQKVLEVVSRFWEIRDPNSAGIALQSLALKRGEKGGGYIDDVSIIIIFRN